MNCKPACHVSIYLCATIKTTAIDIILATSRTTATPTQYVANVTNVENVASASLVPLPLAHNIHNIHTNTQTHARNHSQCNN